MRSNLSFIPELPKTKKGIYDTVKSHFKVGAICSLKGSRRVGKTILLKQLCEELDGYYFDMEVYNCEFDSMTESERILRDLIQVLSDDSVKLVAIDEITKIPSAIYGEIASAIRNSTKKGFIYTGSIPSSVEIVDERIMPHHHFMLNPVNYYEYCDWNSVPVNAKTYTDYLCFANSLDYLAITPVESEEVLSTSLFTKYQGVEKDERVEALREFTAEVLSYTIKSISRDYNRNSNYPTNNLLNAVNAKNESLFEKMLLCTFKLGITNHFVGMPSLNLIEKSKYSYQNLKNFIAGNKNLVGQFRKFLLDTGLAKDCYEWCYDSKGVGEGDICNCCTINDEYLLFEYPCFTNAVTNSNQYEECKNLWIEEEIARQACTVLYGYEFGKFQDRSGDEIDIVSSKVAIEVKNTKSSRVRQRISHYCNVCRKIGISSLIITCNDEMYLGKFTRFNRVGIDTMLIHYVDLSMGLGLLGSRKASKAEFLKMPIDTLIALQGLKETTLGEDEDSE